MWKFRHLNMFLALAVIASGLGFVGVQAQAAIVPASVVILPPTILPTVPPIPIPPPISRSGIWGRITLSPICPVETLPPLPGCAPKPYQTTIAVFNAYTNQGVTKFSSNAQGYFLVSLPAGVYRLESTNQTRYPYLSPVTVVVKPGTYTHTDLSFDTGIR